MIERGLAATAGMWPAIRRAFGWVHRAAHFLGQVDRGPAAVRNQLSGLLGALMRHRESVGVLGPAVDHFVKVSRSYWPGLFACYEAAGLPRTNNDLEHAFGNRLAVARFWAEAEVMAAVKHPNVVQVYELGESDGRPFMAMEFVPGGSLQGRVGCGPFAPHDAAELLAKVASGLAAAHELGIVHRDLKPGNVLLASDGNPKVSDFGLAKRLDHSLTQTQALMGTPAYMAPEQAAGRAKFVGPPADVWALGVILYECVAGKRPFDGDTVEVLLTQIRSAEPRPLRASVGSVPRDVDTIVSKCLAKEPEQRYPTAAELAADLERFLRGEPISVRPVGAIERGYKWVKRNKVVSGASAAVVLALLVGSGVSLGFGLEARKQEKEALKQKKDAEDAAEREEQEKRNAIAARNETQRQSDELKRTLAKALLGPITAKNRGKPLTPYEVEAFWRLAGLRRDATGLLFLEEVTRTPLAWEQLACRTEYILHAAVGLDPDRRRTADRIMLDRLKEHHARGDQLLGLVTSMLRGQFTYPGTATESPRARVEALARETDPAARIARVVSLVPGSHAERADVTRIVQLVVDALAKESGPAGSRALAECLVRVAEAAPDEAFGANSLLRVAAEKATDPAARSSLVEARWALLAVLSRVGKERAPTGRGEDADDQIDDAQRQLMEEMRYLSRSGRAPQIDLAPFEPIFGPLQPIDPVSPRRQWMEVLATVPLGLSREHRHRPHEACVAAIGSFATPHNVVASLPLLHPLFVPPPRPLPPQDLVELLKHPFCVNEARRAVLDALEFTYTRRFTNQWEFVEYAQRNNVHDHTTGKPLDLLTPPKRPEQQP